MPRSQPQRRRGRPFSDFQLSERLASLGLALHRTVTLMHVTQLAPEGDESDFSWEWAALTMGLHPVATEYHLGLVALSLASCTIQVWTDHGFSDPVVDHLLTDRAKIRVLKEVRNALAHPTDYRDKRLPRSGEALDQCWTFANEVMIAMQTFYLQKIAASPGARATLERGIIAPKA